MLQMSGVAGHTRVEVNLHVVVLRIGDRWERRLGSAESSVEGDEAGIDDAASCEASGLMSIIASPSDLELSRLSSREFAVTGRKR